MAKIITFSGRARSGKNCSASLIRKRLEKKGVRVFEMALADWLKCLVAKNFDYDEDKKSEYRTLLQEFGTDKVRSIDKDFWVKIVSMTIDLLKDEYDVFLLTDARFENELDHTVFSHEHQIYNVLVKRDEFHELTGKQEGHSSEKLAERDPDLFDCVIRNDGTLEDLEKLCDLYVNQLGDWFQKVEAA